MTYLDLLTIATRRGLVRWTPSGIVERLRVVKCAKQPKRLAGLPLVVAGSPRAKGRVEHPIWPHRDDAAFNCEEAST